MTITTLPSPRPELKSATIIIVPVTTAPGFAVTVKIGDEMVESQYCPTRSAVIAYISKGL